MSTRYKFWAKGKSGGIKVKGEGVVIVPDDAANQIDAACQMALEAMNETFPGFVHDSPFKGAIGFPTVQKLKT